MRNQIQRKADTCPGRGEGELFSSRTRPFPAAGSFHLWELRVLPAERLGGGGQPAAGGSGGGGGDERGAAGWARTQLASGPCAPKAPGEPGAQLWGQGGAAEEAVLPPAQPLHSWSSSRERQRPSLRASRLGLFHFPSRAKLRDS